MAKKEEEPELKQVAEEQQRQFASMVDDKPTEVRVLRTKKKYLIRWLKNGAVAKLSRLLIHADKKTDNDDGKEGNVMETIVSDSKLACKAAAIIILNGIWSIRFKYWFLWRWFYYVKQYDGVQLQPILDVGKKKVPLIQFLGTTTLLIGVKDTLMQMRTKEVERILQERALEQLSLSEKKENGSQLQDTSSSDS